MITALIVTGFILFLLVIVIALLETAAPQNSKERYYDDLDQIEFIKQWPRNHPKR